MRIFTAVWGEPYLTWFAQGLCPSLKAPRNLKVFRQAKWTVATKPENADALAFMGIRTTLATSLIDSLIETMELCIRDKEPLLMAPPDSIFSDGTLPNLLAYADRSGLCAAMTHVRVLPSILKDAPYTSNLVKLAWEHLHDSWIDAELGPSVTNSLHGGVAWQKLDERTIAVQHRLPTVYLANFTKADLMYFKAKRTFGIWDTTWTTMLMEQERLRYLGSSDAGFVAEVTQFEKNCPILTEVDRAEPDRFNGTLFHNRMLRQFVSILRI